MKKSLLALFVCLISVSASYAQSIGVSYAYSSTAPTNGYSAHFESSVVSLGLVELNSRLRATMFTEENFIKGATAFEKADVLIIDINLLAKVNVIPMVNPYAGIGIAYEKTDFDFANINNNLTVESKNQTEFPVYGSVGIEFSPIPFIKPFLEYRIKAADLKELKDATYESNRGILAIGVAVSF